MRILLEFSPDQNVVHRARLAYAFRLFCAVYGHQPVLRADEAEGPDVLISYSFAPGPKLPRPRLRLSNLYQVRSPEAPAPPPRQYVHDGEAMPVFNLPVGGEEPDWLGEIFEWVSCADEYSIKKRDSVGRIPFDSSYMGRHNLDPRVPYAGVAMRFLQRAIDGLVSGGLSNPQCPAESVRHFVVATHDVDYLPTGRLSSVIRLAKNAVSSCLEGKCFGLAIQQAKMALRRGLNGHDPLDQISDLAEGEKQRAVSASYYFLIRHLHRRDANYTIDLPGLADLLSSLKQQGMEVGLHGSYACLDEPEGLPEEYDRLRSFGFPPMGGRQHWLRFTLDRLIGALERSGAIYDTSIGWVERTGYRAGACFAFPPYNFQEERPARFLEIPMAVMDLTLRLEYGRDRSDTGYDEVAELLGASRRYGWGGISLLWHPAAFGGGWLSPEKGDVYWRLLDHRKEWNDTWLSAAEFIRKVGQRYVEVGLLPENYGSMSSDNEERPGMQDPAGAVTPLSGPAPGVPMLGASAFQAERKRHGGRDACPRNR